MRYIVVDPSSSNSVLGNSALSSPGDYLAELTCTVTNATNSAVFIADGNGDLQPVMPANISSGINVYPVRINRLSQSGKWKVTTDSGVSVTASGIFL